MAIVLECRLAPPKPRKMPAADPATADATSLHYDLFLGDVVFTIDGQDFSAPWGWVPLAGFMGCLRANMRALEAGASVETFEFTESDAKLSFAKAGDDVLVRSNYSSGEAKIALNELSEAVAAEAARLRAELIRLHPSLAQNPLFMEMLE